MTPLKFKCLSCGDCCKRIVIHDRGRLKLTVGLCLMPKERKLFKKYPDAVIYPYIQLNMKNSPETKVVCYQLVTEPCPLLNLETNKCRIYKKRPMVCREFPFSIETGGLSIENNCGFTKLHDDDIKFGTTEINYGHVQKSALLKQFNLFKTIEHMLLENPDLQCMIFDCKKKRWFWREDDIVMSK